MNRPEIIRQDRVKPDRVSLLAPFAGAKPPAPFWFTKAIDNAPERIFVDVAGARIETLIWGEKGKPGLLFLHGNGANADWWSFIAPSFAKDFRIAAFSLSGMGRSGWRDAYSYDQLVDEGLAVMQAAGLFDAPVAPVVIGHSFGAFITSGIAARAGERLRAAIVVDGPFLPNEQRKRGPTNRVPRIKNVYGSLEQALARFRFAPEQSCDNLFIVDWIARNSLMQTPQEDGTPGWTWTFDPKFWSVFTDGDVAADLKAAPCPLAIIGGARSGFIVQGSGAALQPLLRSHAPLISIQNAQHHVMADEPLALIASLRTLFASWPPVS
jgi:pimeloyl-ACP methyl ester carboxylesterase